MLIMIVLIAVALPSLIIFAYLVPSVLVAHHPRRKRSASPPAFRRPLFAVNYELSGFPCKNTQDRAMTANGKTYSPRPKT